MDYMNFKELNGKKIGLLGGSFDPLHNGHIYIAKHCLERASLDLIVFIPAKQNPLKTKSCLFSESERFMMLENSLKDFDNMKVSNIELKRETPSYTYQTILEIKELAPNANLFWIIGDDNLVGEKGLSNWKNVEDLFENITFLVCSRSSENLDEVLISHFNDTQKKKIISSYINISPLKISASQIRENIKKSNFENLPVPKAVLSFIKEKWN